MSGRLKHLQYIRMDERGQLLLEILISVGIAAIVLALISQLAFASLRATKAAAESGVASGLIEGEFDAIEAVAFEKWQKIYDLNKSTSDHYYATTTAGAWTVSAGDESLIINDLTFVRFFTISNVCRDNTTKAIIITAGVPPCTAGNSDDPSVQKITVNLSWSGGSLSRAKYLTRWRNKTCSQTSWTGTGAGPANCPSTLYESPTSVDTSGTPGSVKLQPY
jgi:hypothetical protein